MPVTMLTWRIPVKKVLHETPFLGYAAIEAEAEGILAWMLRGYRAYAEQGIGSCAVVEEARRESISYAAYRILRHRFNAEKSSPTAAR